MTTFDTTYDTTGLAPLPATVLFEARSGAIVSPRATLTVNRQPVTSVMLSASPSGSVPADTSVLVSVSTDVDPESTVELFTRFNGGAATSQGVMTELTAKTFEKAFTVTGVHGDTWAFYAVADGVQSNTVTVNLTTVLALTLTSVAGPTAFIGDLLDLTATADRNPASQVELFYQLNGGTAISQGAMTETTPTSFAKNDFATASFSDGDVLGFYVQADGATSNTATVTLEAVPLVFEGTIVADPAGDVYQGVNVVITATAATDDFDGQAVSIWESKNAAAYVRADAMISNDPTTWTWTAPSPLYAVGDVITWEARLDSTGEAIGPSLPNTIVALPVLTISTDDPDNEVTVGDPVTVQVSADKDPIGAVELHYILNGGTQTDLGPMTELTPLTWENATDTDLIPVDSVYDLWATADGATSNHITVTIVAVVTNEITLVVTPDTVAVLGSVEAHASSPEDTGEIYVLHTSTDGGVTWDAGTAMVADAGTVEFDATLTVATADVGDLHMQARSAGLTSNTVIVIVTTSWILAPVAENPVVGTDLPVTINDTLFANPTETVSLKVKVNDGAEQSFPATYVSQGVWELVVPGATFLAVDDAVEMWGHVLAGDQRGPSTDLVVQATPPPPPFTTLTLEGPAGGQSLTGDPFTLSATADGDPADPVVFFQSIDGGSTWADIGGTEDTPLTFSRLIDSTFAAGSTSHYEARSGAVVSNRISVYFYSNLGTLVLAPPGPVAFDELFAPTLTTAASLPGRMMFTYRKKGDPLPLQDNKPMAGAHPTYTWGTLSGLGSGLFDEDGGVMVAQSYQEDNFTVRSNTVEIVVNPGTPNAAGGLGTISTVPTTFAEGDLALTVTVVNGNGMFVLPVNLYIEINDGPPTLVGAMGGTAPTWTYTFNAPDWVAGDEIVLWARDSDESWGAFPAGWKSGSVVLIVQALSADSLAERTVAQLRELAATYDPPIVIPSGHTKQQIIDVILLAIESDEENDQ